MIAQDTLTPLTATYRYDVLNRLRQKSTFKNYQNVLSYSTSYTYDKMGNILTLNRFASNAPMDSLQYFYHAGTNQLNYVTDKINASNFPNDIDNQNPGNYAYDPTGNLIKDNSEGLEIKWTHYGKVKQIKKNNAPLLSFTYDATGNRLVKDNRQTNEKQIYIRDAQGNVMAVYQTRQDSLFLDELHLYGSSRLGMIKVNEWLPKKDDNITNIPPVTLKASPYTLKLYNFGKKRYELSDWLGNVRVVINDKKTPQGTNASDMTYAAQVLEVNDYYPFGMLARNYNVSSYRFGFNGKEKDNSIKGIGNSIDFGARMLDTRLGKWMSVDPKEINYPAFTSYGFALNSPITAVDPDGKLVVFINGNHYGDGGRATYWRRYRKELVWDRKPNQWLDPGEYHYENVETYAFDKEVMRQFNDFKAIYRDGSMGGYAPLHGMSAKERRQAGYDAALYDAKALLDNLDEGETIKIVSHSMGAAYAKGYVAGLQQYMKDNNITDVKIEIEIDFAPYQPDSEYNTAVPGVPTYQASHSNDKIAGNNQMQGAETIDTSEDSNQGHSIFSFKQTVKKLGNLLNKTREKQ